MSQAHVTSACKLTFSQESRCRVIRNRWDFVLEIKYRGLRTLNIIIPTYFSIKWHPTSDIQHPTFNIPNLASEIRHPTSDIQDSTSDIRHPRSDIRHPRFDIWHPRSDIRHPTSEIRHLTSRSEIRRPTFERMAVMCSAWDEGTYEVRFERKQCGLFRFF